MWFVPLSLCICPQISCVCVVMKRRLDNDTVPDQVQASMRGSQASENRKQEASVQVTEKSLLPAIPLFHWASFRFVSIMLEQNAATRRRQIQIEKNKKKYHAYTW